jgi:hypothetical protein
LCPIFKYDEHHGKEWKEEFKTGLLEIEENINEESIYWDSLKRMDGLDQAIRKYRRKTRIKPVELPLPDSNEVFYREREAIQ